MIGHEQLLPHQGNGGNIREAEWICNSQLLSTVYYLIPANLFLVAIDGSVYKAQVIRIYSLHFQLFFPTHPGRHERAVIAVELTVQNLPLLNGTLYFIVQLPCMSHCTCARFSISSLEIFCPVFPSAFLPPTSRGQRHRVDCGNLTLEGIATRLAT